MLPSAAWTASLGSQGRASARGSSPQTWQLGAAPTQMLAKTNKEHALSNFLPLTWDASLAKVWLAGWLGTVGRWPVG